IAGSRSNSASRAASCSRPAKYSSTPLATAPTSANPQLRSAAGHDDSARRLIHTSGTTKNTVASAKPHSSETACAPRPSGCAPRIPWPDSFTCTRCHLQSMQAARCPGAPGRKQPLPPMHVAPGTPAQGGEPARDGAADYNTAPTAPPVAMPAQPSAAPVKDTPVKVSRALLSVSDKTGLVDLARALAARGVDLLSTGGTAKAIRDAGLPARDVSEATGFPEMMDGRVKTLHPVVHGGLLGRAGTDDAVMAEHGIAPIDLLVLNLYPFERVSADPASTMDEIV